MQSPDQGGANCKTCTVLLWYTLFYHIDFYLLTTWSAMRWGVKQPEQLMLQLIPYLDPPSLLISPRQICTSWQSLSRHWSLSANWRTWKLNDPLLDIYPSYTLPLCGGCIFVGLARGIYHTWTFNEISASAWMSTQEGAGPSGTNGRMNLWETEPITKAAVDKLVLGEVLSGSSISFDGENSELCDKVLMVVSSGDSLLLCENVNQCH